MKGDKEDIQISMGRYDCTSLEINEVFPERKCGEGGEESVLQGMNWVHQR